MERLQTYTYTVNSLIYFDVLIHSYISNTYLNEYQIFYSKSIYDYIPTLTKIVPKFISCLSTHNQLFFSR